jgi:hypothetical protein
MIWLFKIDEVFWNDKPKIDEYFWFNVDDINFDINLYEISLYFPTADYYLINDSNEEEVFKLRLDSINSNPVRILTPKNTEIYDTLKEFYSSKKNIHNIKKYNEQSR